MLRSIIRNLLRLQLPQTQQITADASPWSFGQLEDRVLLAADAGVALEESGMYAEQGYFSSAELTACNGQADTTLDAKSIESVDCDASPDTSKSTPSGRRPADTKLSAKPIVFIDARVSDREQLATDVHGVAEVIVVDSSQSAIEVITKSLQYNSDVPSIHLVGHGQAGFLQLGREGMSRATIDAYRSELQTWRSTLSNGGDILLYGCSTGAGIEGSELLEQLSIVTQLDVAASINTTGTSDVGTDWNLEKRVGPVSSQIVFSQQLQHSYMASLPITIRAAGQTGDESMALQIDGQTVQTWNNIGGDFENGVFQSFTYNGSGVSADRIRVAFTNDLSSGSGYDRNLRVESISIDGRTIRTIEPQVFVSGAWDPITDRPTSGFLQTERLYVGGYFQFAEPSSGSGSSITVLAAGETGQEAMQLFIDNQVVATWTGVGGNATQSQFQTFTFNAVGTVTADQVRVAFTNDQYDPARGIDRNLYVDSIIINNQQYRTDAPTVFSTGTWSSLTGDIRPGFNQGNVLHASGHFAFSNDTTSRGSQVIIRASGSEGGERMELKVAGQTVRGWTVDSGANTNQLQWFGYRAATTVNADQLQIAFVGDRYVQGIFDSNLRVDRIIIDGSSFETEAPNVLSTGTWQDGIQPRFAGSEYLHSDGFFQYSQVGSNRGALALSSNRYSVAEDAAQLIVAVERNGGSDGSLLIDYTLVNGTALSGLDYSAASTTGTLIFLPGQSIATIPISISNDSLYEGNETFNVTIDNLRGSGTLAAPRTATVLINDNDAILPNFSSFTSTQSLQVNGNASLDGGNLRLTRALSNQRGSAFFTAPIPVTSTTSFQTNFGFRLDGGQGASGADGFAFVLQNSPAGAAALGTSAGGALAYGGISKSLIIEFDTFQNSGEISSNHISILIGGSSIPLTTRNISLDLNSGSALRAWIDYNGDARELAVYVSNTNIKPTASVATAAVDLAAIVGNQAFMGFTAATGGAANNHRILDWNMVLTPPVIVPPPPGTNLVNEVVVSGVVAPTAIEFAPDGRNMYVAQKAGQVIVVRDGQRIAAPFIDISTQVNSPGDRGLLDIAVHPDFANNPYVYLLFTYDPPEVNLTSNPLASADGSGNRAGRLIRVTADPATNYTTAVAGSEVVLLGKNSVWANFNAFVNSTNDFAEPPAGIVNGVNIQDFIASDSESHTVGSLEFGIDGALFVSIGDGTSYNQVDRRTVRVQDIDNLSGKVLRIDPITGEGLSDNPFFNGDPNANRSKVYQMGLRNPFRISVDSVTGQLFVGDVGWTQWEEINSAGAGANFGWPYYEGGNGTSLRTGGYQNLPEAQSFYASGQPVVAPMLGLNHSATGINAIVAGAVYRGTTYPTSYVGDLFFNDLGQGIVRNISFNTDGSVGSTQTFATGARFVVQIVQGYDGNLYYVDLDDGKIGRWLFV